MDDTKHIQAVWIPVGAALVIGGYVVISTWIFTALAAPTERHLSVWSVALCAPGAIVLVGLYLIAAGMSPSRWLWLPGKSAMRRRELQHRAALSTLALFHIIGTTQAIRGTADTAAEWFSNLLDFVKAAWGFHEVAPLCVPRATFADQREWVKVVDAQLSSLIERCHIVPVDDDFMWSSEQQQEWQLYLKRASDEFMEYAKEVGADTVKP